MRILTSVFLLLPLLGCHSINVQETDHIRSPSEWGELSVDQPITLAGYIVHRPGAIYFARDRKSGAAYNCLQLNPKAEFAKPWKKNTTGEHVEQTPVIIAGTPRNFCIKNKKSDESICMAACDGWVLTSSVKVK